MKEINLTKGYIAIVDSEDFNRVDSIKWRTLDSKNSKNVYALSGSRKAQIIMHRFILHITDKNIHIDHINGNGLDNRKINLRIATRNQNMRNLQKKRTNNTSGYRGVSFDKESNKWLAYIYVNNKQIKLGRHATAIEAAAAFDRAAKEMFGDFKGKLNLEECHIAIGQDCHLVQGAVMAILKADKI